MADSADTLAQWPIRFHVTGGPMPGLDLTDLSALQEIEDLDYVERMKRLK
jgi:hypothetical protein